MRLPLQVKITLGGLVVTLLVLAGVARKPKDTLVALAVVAFAALLALIPRERITAFAISLNITLLAAVPIFYVHNFGSLKDGIPAACVVASVAALIRRPERPEIPRPIFALFVPFLVVTWFITIRSHDPNGTRDLLIFTIIMLPMLVLASGLTDEGRRGVFRWIVWLAVVEALFSIAQALGHINPIWGRLGVTTIIANGSTKNAVLGGLLRSQGSFGSPIPLALFLVVGFAIACTGVARIKSLTRFVALVMIALGTLFTGSHSGLVIEGLVLIFSIGLGRNWGLGRLLVIIVALTIAAIVVFGSGTGQTEINRFSSSYSVTQRQSSWQSVPRLLNDQGIKQVSVGNGYYSEARIFTTGLLPTDGFGAIDDQWVTTLVESGIVGSLLMIAFYAIALKRADRRMRVVLFAMFGMFFTFDALLWPSATVLIATLIGMALGTRSYEPFSPSASEGSGVGGLASANSTAPSNAVMLSTKRPVA